MVFAIPIVAFPLLHSPAMRMLLPIFLLIGLLPVACGTGRVTVHGNHEVKALTNRQDLLLMADERQVAHYRYLAAEQVGAASRLAEVPKPCFAIYHESNNTCILCLLNPCP